MNYSLLRMIPKDVSNLTLLSPEETLEILGFGQKSDIEKSFKGKNITDIGGGYGALTYLIANYGKAASINSVDPCYNEKIEIIIDRTKEFLDNIVKHGKRRKGECEKTMVRLIEVINNQNDVNYVPCVGHNISKIQDKTQDFVFIINVLQFIVYPKILIEEADRMLKKDGKLYLMGYLYDFDSKEIKNAFCRAGFDVIETTNINNQNIFYVVLKKEDVNKLEFSEKFTPSIVDNPKYRKVYITKNDYIQGGLTDYKNKLIEKYGNQINNRLRIEEQFLDKGHKIIVIQIDNQDLISIKTY